MATRATATRATTTRGTTRGTAATTRATATTRTTAATTRTTAATTRTATATTRTTAATTRPTGNNGNNRRGAGVILIEEYHDRKSGRRGFAFILFRDAKTGTYAEGGGGVDAGETDEQAAERELKEESLGLFRLGLSSSSGTVRPLATVTSHGGKYTCFLVGVRGPPGVGIRRDAYHHNLRKLRERQAAFVDVPGCWLETDDMTRVFVEDLGTGPIRLVRDVYGKRIEVHHRAANVMGKAKTWLESSPVVSRGLPMVVLQKMPDSASKGGDCARGAGVAHTPMWKATKRAVRCYFA